jgi:hypothetical protein
MKQHLFLSTLALAAACSNSDTLTQVACGAGTTLNTGTNTCDPDATCGAGTMLSNGMCVPTSTTPTYVQVEHLARPGINEALVIGNANLEGYNAFAPSFAGAPPAALAAIEGEAKAVLQALYLGGCLLDGVVGLNATTGVHPGGEACAAVGGGLFTNGNPLTGTTLTDPVKTAAQGYAERVFSQFEPDVMRIDTTATSSYLTLCGDPSQPKPLLCGGRWLEDDVIDITYNYLLAGAAISTASPAQFRALVSDGVNYSPLAGHEGTNTVSTADASNPNQGHPAVTQGFPYSAPPL